MKPQRLVAQTTGKSGGNVGKYDFIKAPVFVYLTLIPFYGFSEGLWAAYHNYAFIDVFISLKHFSYIAFKIFAAVFKYRPRNHRAVSHGDGWR